MSEEAPMLDDEVVEGSPMGGATCEDSSPEPMIQPSVELDDIDDVEQTEDNHFPFDSLAVELYEAPDEENASSAVLQQKETEVLPVINTQETVSIVPNESPSEQEPVLNNENIHAETSKSSITITACNNIVSEPTTVVNDSSETYDPNVEMKDVSEPDYKELQKAYIQDFYCVDDGGSGFQEPCDTEELRGIQLLRFPRITKAVETSDYETLQTLYQLLYQRSAWDFKEILVKRILRFSGFNFGKNSEDYFNREMMLRTLPDTVLLKIAVVLGLDQANLIMMNFNKNKMDLISKVLEFLSKPQKKTRGPRTGGEEENVENSSTSQNDKCGCRNRCLLKFTENDKANLLDFLQVLQKKRMFDSYIISLMTCKKIIRKPSEECKKLKEVLYTYKVKMANREINACKGGFCILHGIKMGKLNQLQNKLKTGKKLPTKLKAETMPPIPKSEMPESDETSDKGPEAKVIKKLSPVKKTSEDQNPESPAKHDVVVSSEVKEQIITKDDLQFAWSEEWRNKYTATNIGLNQKLKSYSPTK